MFNDGITPEAIPERIFQVGKILSSKEMNAFDLFNCLEPASLNSDRSYFAIVKKAAIDLDVITERDDKTLELAVDKKVFSTLDNFRFYCNSVIWKDRNSLFYKMVKAFLSSQDELLKYNNITTPNVIQYVLNECGGSGVDIKKIRGIRFWLEFLGLGYIQEKSYIYFLPNMYIALKDYVKYLDLEKKLEKKKEYSIREFVDLIKTVSNVAFEKMGTTLNLNLAFSNALRMMHDRKEIELKKNLDSKETWNLYKSDVHVFGNTVTHIVFKGIK